MNDGNDRKRKRRNWLSFNLFSLMAIITIVALFFIWRQHRLEKQLIDQWIDTVLAAANNPALPNTGTNAPSLLCPGNLSKSQQFNFLFKAINRQPTSERRNCVLKIFAEQFPERAHDVFVKIATTTEHIPLKRNAILLASLYRIEADVNEFERFIDHDDPLIRVAAIDAIGIIHKPAFEIPIGDRARIVVLNSRPNIDLTAIRKHLFSSFQYWPRKFKWDSVTDLEVPEKLQQQILDRMLNDPNSDVRSAAARLLGNHTPETYQLRIAEWGVWINDNEELVLTRSVLDEVPDFVHRTNDSIEEITENRQLFVPVTKPIIHFQVDQPLVIDLSIRIARGRPWFVYPIPDDYSLEGISIFSDPEMSGEHYRLMDPGRESRIAFQKENDLRAGYPWLLPRLQTKSTNVISEVGFRWQSLIAVPEKTDWMNLEPITDKRFAWWKRLREVPTAWISNRGDSDRFLYYDGPTRRSSPIRAQLQKSDVEVMIPSDFPLDVPRTRHLFFIEVTDGQISAIDQEVTFEREPRLRTEYSLPIDELPLKDDAVKKRLIEILVDQGLQTKEAEGLVDCWTPQFFETNGKRLLTVFGTQEYDHLCPMEVSPTPTELVRVGIVLTEFHSERTFRPSK